jgi:hypothetical protein
VTEGHEDEIHVSRPDRALCLTYGLGLWQAGGDWGAVDEAAETATIRRALDLGINFGVTWQVVWGGVV